MMTSTMLVVYLLALTVGLNVLTVADGTMLEGLVAPIGTYDVWRLHTVLCWSSSMFT